MVPPQLYTFQSQTGRFGIYWVISLMLLTYFRCLNVQLEHLEILYGTFLLMMVSSD